MKASKIATAVEKVAPIRLAEKWDNPGFQVGDKGKDVKTVLTALDLTPEVLNEAIEAEVDMIVTHHPFFFTGLKNIDTASVKGKLIKKLLENDIVVYSAHTNLDKANGGLNYYVGELLGLEDMRPLSPHSGKSDEDRLLKFVVFVPQDYQEPVLEAIDKYGAGSIGGNYTTCAFITPGTGTFRPEEGANPFIGEVGVMEQIPEARIETVIQANRARGLVEAVKKVHPYEEMAYDLHPDENFSSKVRDGLGIIGEYSKPLSPEEFVELVKRKLELKQLRQAGERPDEVKKVAICTGAGAEFIERAKNRGADVYVTGDLKHHDAQKAWEIGMWTIDAGHFGTEWVAAELLAEILRSQLPENAVDVEVSKSLKDFIELI